MSNGCSDNNAVNMLNANEWALSFARWSPHDQLQFVSKILHQMSHFQLVQVDEIMQPLLKRDFIHELANRRLLHIAEAILFYLDADSLLAAEQVSPLWAEVISHSLAWKRLIERKIASDTMWQGLAVKLHASLYLKMPPKPESAPSFSGKWLPTYSESPKWSGVRPHECKSADYYRQLYPHIFQCIRVIEDNWLKGNYQLQRIDCRSENSKGVYCLQYDENKIVSGLRDNTIKVWDRRSLEQVNVLPGHSGSVLCLQYDEHILISGSSDCTVRVWDIHSYECISVLHHHSEAVLHLRFHNGMLVTCSKDRTIVVWEMISPKEIRVQHLLVGHKAAVNVVDFDERYIVSASGDRSIRVWNTNTCEYVRMLTGHKRGIACLQYRGCLVVSGSSDNAIRLWDVDQGICLRVMEGHNELVRCIRFDDKRIISGSYNGEIKIWDLEAALDPQIADSKLCIRTLHRHVGRVFRLQFDDFHIISSSHDDTILIWDFVPLHSVCAPLMVQMPPMSSAAAAVHPLHYYLVPTWPNVHLCPRLSKSTEALDYPAPMSP